MLFLQAVAQYVPEAVHALVEVRDISTDNDPEPLRVWAEHWGFTDDWLLQTARTHVELWRADPTLAGRWQMVSATARWEPVFPPAPSWNPITESETAFRRRVGAYIAICKQMPGLMSTPTKASLASFEWLALHHVGRWTYTKIAAKYSSPEGYPDMPAVSRAIHSTAALIGLTLRPRRGRKLRPRA
jgi:hypothetical protein